MKMRVFWDIALCSLGVDRCFRGITLVMEAVWTSEMLVYSSETTRRYIPEGSHLYSHRCENLKSHKSHSHVICLIDIYMPCCGSLLDYFILPIHTTLKSKCVFITQSSTSPDDETMFVKPVEGRGINIHITV
jgi:hypothetical protein